MVSDISEQVDAGGAFDPANFQTVLLIQLNRLYDLNLAFLALVNPQKAQELYALHEGGEFMCPAPAFAYSQEEPPDPAES